MIRNPSSTKFPQCNFPLRVTGYPTHFAFFTMREKLHVNWFDQRSLFHKLYSMPFSTEGDSVSYTFYIFHKRKTSCQLIWSQIPLPRTFLHAIFHRVSYTFYIFHIERKYEQLYHCSFSIPSKSLKKKVVNTLSFTFFFFLLLNFLLFLNSRVYEILFIYLFIILLCVDAF